MLDLPATAAWRHLDARIGFEVLFARRERDGYLLEGHAAAVEEGEAWGIRYALNVDSSWATRLARIVAQSARDTHEVRLEGDGNGAWLVDGSPEPSLDGCFDVDLQASACTNALPINRLGLAVGERADAPAVYVRMPDLRVERLEQSYARLPNDGEHARYDYVSPAFDFRAALTFDAAGLVVNYPGIALRAA